MGVTVKKSPAVKLFDGWFDEHTYFKSKNALIKVSDVLDLIYSMLSECTNKKVDDETVGEYDDKVKKIIVYYTNAKSKKHYQHYKKQYQDYTEKHIKLKLDYPVNVAIF
eukprot:9156588-Ditylum_brightwellii.AAC.1